MPADPQQLTPSGRLVGPVPASRFPEPGPDVFMGSCLINGVRYANKALIRVANVTVDGTTCTVPLSDLVDTISSGGKYEVEVTEMRWSEFLKLEEFVGW